MQQQDLIEVEEVAKILHVTVETVRTYIGEGKLPAFKVGRGYLVDRAEGYKFLQARRTDRDDSKR